MRVDEVTKQLGIEIYREFEVYWLIPEPRIRDLCSQNKCGSYGNNYMCPPIVGSLRQIQNKLKKFRYGMIFQYVKYLNASDKAAVIESQKDFHAKILTIEKYHHENGISPVWGMIGGNCRLCDPCGVKRDEPCLHPDKARMSLEAIGIDVLRLLDRLGLDSRFHNDRVIWTGCILLP